MPLPLFGYVLEKGLHAIPGWHQLVRTAPWLAAVTAIKLYTAGPSCHADTVMHSKVVMMTGGTSGIGAVVARELAQRGAQIILLTQQPPGDPFVEAFVSDLREQTGNALIYAEQCDLGSLHSIRRFATRWLDNVPPRRLDLFIGCAATVVPKLGDPSARTTEDGLEACWAVNYLSYFHLLGLLSPSCRAQPPDRDVRIILATCGSYRAGDLKIMRDERAPLPKGREFPTSKLALMVFARAFQKHLEAYARPDKAPNNARVVMVDPGFTRTPGMRRWLSLGSVWGLLFYLILWPLWWLFLRSAEAGAQGFLQAAMDPAISKAPGGQFLRGVLQSTVQRPEIEQDTVAEELWKFSERQITAVEKEGAVKRARSKTSTESQSTTANSNAAGPNSTARQISDHASQGVSQRKMIVDGSSET